jgi:hypothetical protein
MHLVNFIRNFFEPLEPGDTAENREDFWGAYASALVALPLSGRLEIGQDVLDASYAVMESQPKTILGALHLVRPPFPVTWLEWYLGTNADARRRGWLLVEDEPGTYKAILYELETDEFMSITNIGAIIRTEIVPRTPSFFDRLTAKVVIKLAKSQKIAMHIVAKRFSDPEEQKVHAKQFVRNAKKSTVDEVLYRKQLAEVIEPCLIEDGTFDNVMRPGDEDYFDVLDLCLHLVALLLLLNSRNATDIGVEPDFKNLNRARLKKGKKELLAVRPVVLDITRRLRAARRAGAVATTEEIRAALVRGHFKVRKSGVFWWSPHIRGNAGSLSGRDYLVRARD